jgi:peroxisomal 2,4-dienoyl-CoA reductase
MGRRAEVLEAARRGLAAEGIDAFAVRGDVRSAEDAKRVVAETVRRFGSLSILVNSAAGNFLSPAEDLSPKGFATVISIDTVGVFTMSHAAFPHLKQRGDSTIVNISAMLHEPATWFQAHASAAKAAIDSLTRSLALEWGEYGIRVAGLAPGPIAGTAGMDKLAAGIDPELLSREIPLRRWGSTKDIALSAVYLCSDAAAFVTGKPRGAKPAAAELSTRRQCNLIPRGQAKLICPVLCSLVVVTVCRHHSRGRRRFLVVEATIGFPRYHPFILPRDGEETEGQTGRNGRTVEALKQRKHVLSSCAFASTHWLCTVDAAKHSHFFFFKNQLFFLETRMR